MVNDQSIDQWLEEATPDRRRVPVCLDRRLLSDLLEAKVALEEAKLGAGPEKMLGSQDTVAAEERVRMLEQQIAEHTRMFVFEGIGFGPWRELMSEHPPKPEQASVFRQAVELGFMPHSIENIGFNAETFVPAAVEAACTEPGITKHQAAALLRKAPPGVIERIWTAVLEANVAGHDDPFVEVASAAGSG